MTQINAINFNTPFLQGVPNSRISPEWIRLFIALVGAVQSPNVISSDDFQAFVFTSRKPVDQTNPIDEIRNSLLMLYGLKGLIRDALRRLDDLEKQQLPVRTSASAANEVSVLDDITTNATMYPLYTNGTGGLRLPKTSSTKWTFNPSTGTMTSNQLVATTGFGCNGATPQTAFASGGAAPAGGTGTAAGGWDTAAHRDAAITLLNNIRTALINVGIMS